MKCNNKCNSKQRKLLFNIYENTVNRDINTNENINTPVKVGTIWGLVKNKSPYYKEFNNSTYNDEITHVITVNYIEELNTKKWLELDNKIFEIMKIINVAELNTELQLFCKIREQR